MPVRSTPHRWLLPISVAVLLCPIAGCRAIGRFGDSRQTITARRLSGQGFQAMHDGRWDIAETLFSEALSVSKADDRAHWGLAESLWQRGQRDQAIEHMEQAIRLSAGDPKLVQRMGRMYLDLGQLEQADRHSKWALQLQRDSEDAWALRGDCLRATGDNEAALAAYHRALALRPDFPEVQLKAAEIYRDDGRFDRLLATLDRMQEGSGIDDAPARANLLRGIAMRRLGRYDEARRLLARAATAAPEDPTIHLELASVAVAQGRLESARQSIAEAQRLAPDSSLVRQRIEQLAETQQRIASQPPVGQQR